MWTRFRLSPLLVALRIMGPAPNATAATPRRQSCDRCHVQKLRCSRSSNCSTGVCDRCLRKGAPCSYSSSLPQGRPSLYRLDEVPAGSRDSGKTLPGPSTSAATTPTTAITTDFPPALSVTHITRSTHGDTTPGSQAVAADIDADADDYMDVELSASWSANTNLTGAEALVFPGSVDSSTHFQVPWRLPEELSEGNMLDMSLNPTLNWDPTMKAQFHASSEFSGAFQSDSGGVSTGNKGGADQGHPCENVGLQADLGKNSSISSSSSYGGVFSTPDSSGFELSIAHLSRLCMRLSQLLLSRYFLTETLDSSRQSKGHDTACEDQPLIETIFKSINSWLLQGSANTNLSLDSEPLRETRTTSDLLHHVFSASNHLLEILRYLHVSVLASTSIPSTACPFLSSSSHSSSSHAETTTRSPGDGRRSSQHSHTTLHHLVLACVTLLLKIYVAILIALQRSADTLNSSLLARNLVEPSDHMDAASRGHIKLVSVVQLCSYFIKRQNQTLNIILSSQGSLRAPSSQKHGPQQSASPDVPYRHAIGELSDLKTEVDQHLKRLQESLCIVT